MTCSLKAFPPAASRWPARIVGGVALTVSIVGLACGAPHDIAVAEKVPQLGGNTLLSWRERPPYVTNASVKHREARRGHVATFDKAGEHARRHWNLPA